MSYVVAPAQQKRPHESVQPVVRGDQAPSRDMAALRSRGAAPANAPFPIASLSKLITGLCITRFVQAGRISYQTALGEALARLFAHIGAPVDPRFRAVTIAQLLTHTSGFTDEMTKDAPKPDSPDAITRGAARKQITHPLGSRHQYANANFAILDRVIEELSGQRYDVSCRRMVPDPVGAGGASLFHDYRPPPTWVDWKFSPGFRPPDALPGRRQHAAAHRAGSVAQARFRQWQVLWSGRRHAVQRQRHLDLLAFRRLHLEHAAVPAELWNAFRLLGPTRGLRPECFSE
jgi:CubicO group peptidase (beta-lactamase class C family)